MVTLILFFINVFMIYALISTAKAPAVRRRWAGTYKHTIVLILAWLALAVLVSLVMLLNLFEGNNYSMVNFLEALQLPWMLLTAGLIVVLFTLWSFKISCEQER